LNSSVSSPSRQIIKVPPLTHHTHGSSALLCWTTADGAESLSCVPMTVAPSACNAVGSDHSTIGQAVCRVALVEGEQSSVELKFSHGDCECPMLILALTSHNTDFTTQSHTHTRTL
jgi:hypothetical protein